jgi:predicted nucleotide-binding protein
MSKITIIDDDAALELLAENLSFQGHEVRRFNSISSALSSLDDILSSEFVVLDIYMDIPVPLTENLASGIRTSGMAVYKQIRLNNKKIPILVYSACQEKDTIDLIKKDPNSRFLAKSTSPSLKHIVSIIETELGIERTPPKPNVFIVHGHNDTLKYELKNYLQNTLGLPEPIILHEKPNMGRTLIQKFEDYAYSSNLAFILLTPDDKPANTDDSDDEKRRARQNVILELGFFLGKLGRETGRVILLYTGPLELPSDLSGVTYIDISNGIGAAGEEIRRELNDVSQQSW